MCAVDAMRRRLLGAAALGAVTRWANAADDSDFWRQLRSGGCVVLMRHATTEPGTGDISNRARYGSPTATTGMSPRRSACANRRSQSNDVPEDCTMAAASTTQRIDGRGFQ